MSLMCRRRRWAPPGPFCGRLGLGLGRSTSTRAVSRRPGRLPNLHFAPSKSHDTQSEQCLPRCEPQGRPPTIGAPRLKPAARRPSSNTFWSAQRPNDNSETDIPIYFKLYIVRELLVHTKPTANRRGKLGGCRKGPRKALPSGSCTYTSPGLSRYIGPFIFKYL